MFTNLNVILKLSILLTIFWYVMLTSAGPLKAQVTSVQEKLFKLKPHQNQCPNTYRALELNQDANELAGTGALVSYDKNQAEMAEVLAKSFEETKPGSVCCKALAQIGYPCLNDSKAVSEGATQNQNYSAILPMMENALAASREIKSAANEADIAGTLDDNLSDAKKRLQTRFDEKIATPDIGSTSAGSVTADNNSLQMQREQWAEILKKWELDRQKDAILLQQMERELDAWLLGLFGDLTSIATKYPLDINKFIYGSGIFTNFYTTEAIFANTMLSSSIQKSVSSIVSSQMLKPWLKLPIGPKPVGMINRKLTFDP